MSRASSRKATAFLATLGLLGGLTSCNYARIGAWSIAQEHFADEEYREAIEESDKLLRYGTASSEERASVYLLQARSHEKLGETNEALGLYKYVQDSFPDTPQSYQAKEALAALEQERSGSLPPPGKGIELKD